jgi:peptidoglycan/xylan/chitin deacetylase (PgdA/CDA1 family)
MILIIVILLLILLWGFLYPLTDFYIRRIAPAVIKKGNAPGKKICLTFDDGPDPEYTPALLKILQEAGVPAAFFLVGQKCETAPELAAAIRDAGHEIGLHTYYHRHAYLMFLFKSLTTIRQGKSVLEKITNQPLTFFRPPWGALNLFQYLFVKRLNLKIVLWTATARDWDLKTKAGGIMGHLHHKVGPNSIIVLHDSGGDPGAPQNMLQALPRIIDHFKTNGYQFVSLQEISAGMESGGTDQ